ncbi:pyridoxine/pyridoxal/pyridoxamine kinase [Saccharibacillus endophyticus]|uniref:pyridoxal kinase n=1 Tax=Saccharibacillus endophyticus TaxID=2060666 RepID=A0ABQ1ZR80_9BACL|nr:pyridoxine/pyridoxal/pyridoxamine kinase [Saccharibacillus endophyticus]GGH76441.1 pyridoxine kinase [Saccharibacillus endophyticus]
MTIPKVLTIAGSDTSGGAGIQADLKTFQELNVYGMTALTCVVTMDPQLWSHHVTPMSAELLESQLDTVLNGIGVTSAKTGMLSTVAIIDAVARKIEERPLEHFVVDPVMVCKGENEVLNPDTAEAILEKLVPKATVVTPNLFEASQLAKTAPIRTVEDMKNAAAKIHELGAKHVVIKGGGKLLHEKAVDLIYDGQEFELLESDRIETNYIHGAGCTFSAAITAELAKGADVRTAVKNAKAFVTAAIRHGFPINSFVGPTLHAAHRLYRD